jgi:ribosomal protein L17
MSEIGSLVKDFLQLHQNEQRLRKQVSETAKMTKDSKASLIEAMENSDLQRIRHLQSNADIILEKKPKKNSISTKNIKEILKDANLSPDQIDNIVDKMTTKSEVVNKILKIKKVSKDPSEMEVVDE